ncbi:MAG: GDP-mannose-dependent alpha-mannosyltransferase [Parcubacteria group bacterium ADurb.Bin247]|jgi:glycosyltransferase involved in cell wall biosynthesis|nr:MAG: GDP-mannose-dependent alpha-mannosyltransferase [Parcubacteria group bacterium ADurb.Bin247]
MENKIKILACSLEYPLPNGVTISLNTSITELKRMGIKTIVISPDYNIGKIRKEHYPLPPSIIVKNIGAIAGRKANTFGAGLSMFAYPQIKEIIKRFNPDIYWLNTIAWTINPFEIAMLETDKPKVVTYHTLLEDYGKIYAGEAGAIAMKLKSELICNRVDAIIVPSKTIRDKLYDYGVIKPIHVIPTGISFAKRSYGKQELKKRFNIPKNSKVLLYVGRISKEKNIEFLLDILKRLQNKINCKLLIIGMGDIDQYKNIAKTKEVLKNTIFVGEMPKKEIEKIYGACDVFVFASQTETQGIVIGEAMASGLPVVILDSKISKEVYPQNTAIIAKNKDEFITGVLNVLNNNNDIMINNAKEFVNKNFSKEKMIKDQFEIFNNLFLQYSIKNGNINK